MSKFKKVGGDCWVHVDLPSPVFEKKPPEWMEGYIVRIYNSGFSDGERYVQEKISEALSFLIPEQE